MKYKALRTALRDAGFSRTDVARELKLSESTVSRKLSGEAEWRMGEMYALMKMLGIPATKLYVIFPENGDAKEGKLIERKIYYSAR